MAEADMKGRTADSGPQGRKAQFGKFVLTLATLAWMAVIFGFSADTAEESSGLSMKIARLLAGLFMKGFRDLPLEDQERVASSMQFLIRKGAHMSEYALLGVLLVLTLTAWGFGRRILAALGSGVFYAALDEFHQTFVPGRSGQVRDVLIDSLGLCLGILFLHLVLALVRCLKGKGTGRENRQTE